MDYSQADEFGKNWSESRYKVLPYFEHEWREIRDKPSDIAILDLGCANGWNMSRFRQYGKHSIGLDVNEHHVAFAKAFDPVLVSSGLSLPFPKESFDVIYIQHVLHHIGDRDRALREVARLLRKNGRLILIETVEDNPIIRYGRNLYPSWRGDIVNERFTFAELKAELITNGFTVEHADQYSILFWIWEIFPDRFPVFEKLTPLFVKIEQLADKLFHKHGAHCYYIASPKAGQS